MEVIFNNDYFKNNSHFNFSHGQLFMESLKQLFLCHHNSVPLNRELLGHQLLVEYVNVYFSIMMSIMFATKSKT